jgi:hypothetical protein
VTYWVKKISERYVHNACEGALKKLQGLRRLEYWRIPVCGIPIKTYNGRLHLTKNQLEGFSDFLVLIPGGKVLFPEIKKPAGGKQSPVQKRFQERVEQFGSPYRICHTLDELLDFLEDNGVNLSYVRLTRTK